MKNPYILALDQGTTSCRSVIVNKDGAFVAMAQKEFRQIFPKSGWVEHDAEEILATQLETIREVIKKADITLEDIQGLGITNQRETAVVWNKTTGKPIYNAIVWQDNRTTEICEMLKKEGLATHVQKTTGLVIDTYFSATKIKWILDHVKGARAEAEKGNLLFGTMDTWLIWNLTDGKVHATDYTNASRTLLYDISRLDWDQTLLETLQIPKQLLPEVKPSSAHFGDFYFENHRIPIAGVAGDQQAALFGQHCFEKGEAKNTYGTGCFLLMNTGTRPQFSENGLLTTIAWGVTNEVYYAIEGSIFVAGAAIQWLRDGLQIIGSAQESETFAKEVEGENPVIVVPAFSGLGAPYWDMYARGAIFGLTRDTGKSHLIKATLDALAFQTKDILLAMESDANTQLTKLKVDGGACANNVLMQFQADILNTVVERPKNQETTVLGAAYLAGITVGLWTQNDLLKNKEIDSSFSPNLSEAQRTKQYSRWLKAIERSKNWVE